MGKPLMDDCEFFATENEAIAYCRECNAGALRARTLAAAPWWPDPENPTTSQLVDLETAKRLTDDGQGAPHLIVT